MTRISQISISRLINGPYLNRLPFGRRDMPFPLRTRYKQLARVRSTSDHSSVKTSPTAQTVLASGSMPILAANAPVSGLTFVSAFRRRCP
jgi:hypothetical protein